MSDTATPILDAWRAFNEERARAVGAPPTLHQAPRETRDEHEDAGARWLVHFCQKHGVHFAELVQAMEEASAITCPNITALLVTGALKPLEVAEASFAAGWASAYFTALEQLAEGRS